jgi:hypothetical protein
MNYNRNDEELVFFGPGLSANEMDTEFRKLYDSLINYKNNIFHLIDTVCNDCETGERLAMNIAERDSALLQRLVAKECESRRMQRKAQKESVLEKLREEGKEDLSVKEIMEVRTSILDKED